MNTEDIKILAGEVAENIIDKYLDVTDLHEEFDVTEFTSEDIRVFSVEVARVVEEWTRTQIEFEQLTREGDES
jgi:hypothetical protein